MLGLILLGSVMLSANPVAANPDSQLEKCLAAAQGIAPVHRCYQDALGRVERAIAERVANIPPRLREGKVAPDTFITGEEAWKAYRDKWCAFEEAAERDPEARSTTGLQCRVETSQDHLARLRHPF